jgi:site-specific DNA recombinase
MRENRDLTIAVYARVSSEQQAEEGTISSQISALKERVKEDGFVLDEAACFIDEGYSGATLVRPALERLRDSVANGAVDRIYVHSPDRLARKYAYQVLLVDEFHRCGVEVIYLNHSIGNTPEESLLLQVQGMVAEYERAKIMERSRRGKLHAARQGTVNVLSGAPYGYRYINRHEGDGESRYEVIDEEARVVRQVFEWIGQERCSIGEVCRRLKKAGIRTRTGKTTWDRTTVWGMLKNPAYKGEAAFGKTRIGSRKPQLRTQRGKPAQPRRNYSIYGVAEEDWISIAVPPIVSEALFLTVQEQLTENRKRSRQRARGARYLLQGLLVCKRCGYAYYGKPVSRKAAKGNVRHYAYYRCVGTDAYRFGGQRVCDNKQVRTDMLETAVWEDVRHLLANPERIEQEYHRRLTVKKSDVGLEQVESRVNKVKRGIGRLIDAYSDGLLEKTEFEPRIRRARERLARLQAEAKERADEASQLDELRMVIGRLQEFAEKVNGGLDGADWATRREIIRTLVKRVEVDQMDVRVVYRIGSHPFDHGPERGRFQYRLRGLKPDPSESSTG